MANEKYFETGFIKNAGFLEPDCMDVSSDEAFNCFYDANKNKFIVKFLDMKSKNYDKVKNKSTEKNKQEIENEYGVGIFPKP
jgi:hypothetical protein